MALAPVWFAYPIRQVLFILADDLEGFVRASPVYDDILQLRITLFQDTPDGLLYVLSLVKGGRYDGYFRQIQRHLFFSLRPTLYNKGNRMPFAFNC